MDTLDVKSKSGLFDFINKQRTLPGCKDKAVNVFITNTENDIQLFNEIDKELPEDLKAKLALKDVEKKDADGNP